MEGLKLCASEGATFHTGLWNTHMSTEQFLHTLLQFVF